MKISLYLIIAVLLGSCTISEDVVQEGPFQKRKYFKKGWFFDRPLKRGLEVLEQDGSDVADAGHTRDPYLQMLPAELAAWDTVDHNRMASLDLLAGPVLRTGSNVTGPQLLRIEKASTVRATYAFVPKVPAAPLPDPEVSPMGSPLIITGFALLVPVALLLALLLILQRFLKNDNASTAVVVALLMGLVGLAALAVT